MSRTLKVGDFAPNFDMASTEDVVLMLCDEVPRTPVLLYFFSDSSSEQTRSALAGLSEAGATLAESGIKTFGVSRAKLDELKSLQKTLKLGFPLLHDDRNLSAAYGFEEIEEASSPDVALLVGRAQRVLWMAEPAPSATDIAAAAVAAAKGVSSTVNYPRKVINRLVDLWVN